jgi:Arc/MetJ-type ribon-helix-helix transcriptional regulator
VGQLSRGLDDVERRDHPALEARVRCAEPGERNHATILAGAHVHHPPELPPYADGVADAENDRRNVHSVWAALRRNCAAPAGRRQNIEEFPRSSRPGERTGNWDATWLTHGILYSEGRITLPTKVNIVLDDDVKADLDRLVESGKRSRVINSALRREIQLMSRRAASVRLDEIRATTKPVSTADIVKLVRRDRGR